MCIPDGICFFYSGSSSLNLIPLDRFLQCVNVINAMILLKGDEERLGGDVMCLSVIISVIISAIISVS